MTSPAPSGEQRWWNHPDRACKGDERYADLVLASRKERREMALACCSCPVYFECLEDLLAFPSYEHYGIRAGIQGKT